MRVIARCPFNDEEAKALRVAGDTFDCSEERARRLVALNLAAIAKEQPEPEQVPVEPAEPAVEDDKSEDEQPKKAAPEKKADKKTE